MARTKTLTGRMFSIEDPPCWPLHSFVGYDLCSQFMLMFDVMLSNGHVVRAFKHHRTRCYLHLDRTEPGLAYEYRGNHRYRPIDLGMALIGTFRLGEAEPGPDRERDRVLLDLALDRLDAASGEAGTDHAWDTDARACGGTGGTAATDTYTDFDVSDIPF